VKESSVGQWTLNSEQGLSVFEAARIAASRRFLRCLSAGCRPHDFPQYPPNYREYAYVTNGGSDTVTVLDVVNVRVDRELPVGHNPVAVAASPTRNEVYVVNCGAAPDANGSLSVIDAEHNAVVATIPLHRQPVSIDLDAAGKPSRTWPTPPPIPFQSSISMHAEKSAQIGAGDRSGFCRASPPTAKLWRSPTSMETL
jgi:YVTN family beta-propeller protein